MVTVAISNTAPHKITITPCDDSGTAIAAPNIIGGSTIADIVPAKKRFQPVPYFSQGQFGQPAPPATAQPDYYPVITHYVARIKLNGGLTKYEDLDLTQVYGQPTWANDVAGQAIAIAALSAAMP